MHGLLIRACGWLRGRDDREATVLVDADQGPSLRHLNLPRFYEREFARADEVVKQLNWALWGLAVVSATALVDAGDHLAKRTMARVRRHRVDRSVRNDRERPGGVGRPERRAWSDPDRRAGDRAPTRGRQGPHRPGPGRRAPAQRHPERQPHDLGQVSPRDFTELYEPRPTPHSPGTGTALGHRADSEQPRPRRVVRRLDERR